MPAIDLVIFDCDGTLMDSELFAAEAEIEAVKPYGVEISTQEFIARFGGTASGVFEAWVEEQIGRSLPDDHASKVDDDLNQRLWRGVKTVEGAHELLDAFDQPRCICSNAPMEKLKIELTRGELWDRFRPFIYSAKDIDGPGKPAPDLFLHAAKEFEVSPKNCVVVEDSVSGVAGAKAAGMRVIGFTGASHTFPGHADALTEAGAETVLNKLIQVAPVLEAFAEWSETP